MNLSNTNVHHSWVNCGLQVEWDHLQKDLLALTTTGLARSPEDQLRTCGRAARLYSIFRV